MLEWPGSHPTFQAPVKQSLLHYAQLAAVVIVAVGCWQVLHPFIPALLFAAERAPLPTPGVGGMTGPGVTLPAA